MLAGLLSLMVVSAAAAQPNSGLQARQQSSATPVVVVDMQQVLQQAAAAMQLRLIEREERLVLRDELDRLTESFEQEEALLTRLRDELDRDDFDRRVQDFDQRVRAARQRAQEGSVAFQNRFAEAFAALEKETAPVIIELMAERGATIAFDRRSALVVTEGADITQQVIERLDAVLSPDEARALLPPMPAPR